MNQFLHFCVEYANLLTIGFGVLLTALSFVFSIKHHSDQLRSYIPTIWTSLGIFFTFLSIYVTLKDYAAIPDDQISMSGIIKGIIPAFSTSVIGILGAIITAYIDKWKKSRGEARDNFGFERFSNGEAFGKDEVQTPDIILLELVREISGLISETHRKINTLSEDLISTLDKNFALSIDNVHEHKIETISCFKDTIMEQNSQLKEYVKTFVSEANKTHEENISALLKGFAIESKERETKHREEMNDLKKDAKDYIGLIKDTLCNESAARQEDIKIFIHDESEERRSFVKEQNQGLTSTLNLARESINNAVNDITNLFECQIKQHIEDFAKTQYEKCIGLIDDEFKSFQENSEKTLATQESESADFLHVLSGALKEAHSSIISDISSLKDSIVIHLNSLFDENRVNQANILESYKEYLSQTASLISDSAESMSGSLAGFCLNLHDKAEKLELKHLETIAGIQRTGEESITKVLEIQATKIDEAIEMYKDELETLSLSISKTGQKMAEDIVQFCQNLGQRTTQLENDHMNLVETIHSQGEERINEALSRFLDQLETLSTTISGTGQKMVEDMELFCSNLDTRTERLEIEHLKRVEGIHADGEEKIKDANEKFTKDVSILINAIQQLRTSVQSASMDYVGKHEDIKKQIIGTTSQLMDEISRVAKDSTQVEALERVCENLNEKLNETISALDNKYQTITSSLESVASSIDAYSHVADDTKTLNKYVNSTVELYKVHSTKMTLLESSLTEMTNTIINAIASISKSSSVSPNQGVKSSPSKKK